MNERIIFGYRLTDAWMQPFCRVSVFENGEVKYQEEINDAESIVINKSEIEKIETIIEHHPEVFEYQWVEFPNILDGVMNFFEFSNAEGKENRILAFNVGEVKNPDANFLPGLLDKNVSGRYVTPVKAMEVVRTFEEIAKVLLENGVDANCLRLE